MTFDEQVLAELHKISRILSLVNSKALESELSKYVNTDDRRRMWILIDGIRMPKQIAAEARASERAANYFLAALVSAELIKYERGQPPSKLFDFVPASWTELISKGEADVVQKPEDASQQATLSESSSPEQESKSKGGNDG
jgi:hypothetical protein